MTEKKDGTTLSKVTDILLFSSILVYITAIVVGDAFVYIIAFVTLVTTILFKLLVLLLEPMWKLLPEELKRTYKIQKGRFRTIILLITPLFFIIVRGINNNFIRKTSISIRILEYMGVVAFATFFAWSFIRNSRWRTIFVSIGIFGLFVALLSFINSTTSNSGELSQTDSLKKLAALGYVDWAPPESEEGIKKAGVTQYDPELAFNGVNLYVSKVLSEVYLIDMYGNIVHKWSADIETGKWRYAEMCDNGDILVLATTHIIRLDWNSNIKWHRKMRVHHDVWIGESGKIYVLGREEKLMFWHAVPLPVLSDYVAVLSSDGKLMEKTHLYRIVDKLIPFHKVIEIYAGILDYNTFKKILKYKMNDDNLFDKFECFDILHTNSFEILNRDIDNFCNKGNWLVSLRTLNTVVVIESENRKVTWNWGPGEIQQQHHPTLLENGNLLIFDNGTEKAFTRVVELNPSAKKLVWEYKSTPPEEFFTSVRGSNQRLPNGNTLITESNKGRVFEVTKKGKVVWEFYNPNINKENGKREVIYRMIRIWGFEKNTPANNAVKKTGSLTKI